MPDPKVLIIELSRSGSENKPYAFDGKPQEYVARGAKGTRGKASLPWDEVEKLSAEFLHVDPHSAAQKQMGDLLRRFLEDVLKELEGWGYYEDALLKAEGKPSQLRLLFRFNAGELFSLPWALTTLRNNRRLGSIQPCPLRFEWAHSRTAPASSRSGDRVLFAWSNAEGWVGEEDHLKALRKACASFQPAQDELPQVTLDSLKQRLKQAKDEGKPFRILHFLCHGGQIPGKTFGLFWDNPATPGKSAPVDGATLCDVLGPYQSELQAIVLSACHGGNPGQVGSMLGGVAHDLNGLGIPAVIASQRPLCVKGSVRMTEAFYTALCQQKASVQESFEAAYAALSPSSLDWVSLQLFVSSPQESARPPGQRVVFPQQEDLSGLLQAELPVAYEVNFNVSTPSIAEALEGRGNEEPDVIILRPLDRVGDALPATQAEWRRSIAQADRLVEVLGERVDQVHLFGCAPLPLMFHLGWRLGRRKLRAYQEQRGGRGTWTCGYDSELVDSQEEHFFRVDSWPAREACRAAKGRVVMTIEVNLSIQPEELERWLGSKEPPAWVRLVAARGPSPTVLRGPLDTKHAVEEFRTCLDRLHAELPDVQEVWLALACPASLAAALGRAYNPKAQPPLTLFNFRKAEGYVEVPWDGGVKRKSGRRS